MTSLRRALTKLNKQVDRRAVQPEKKSAACKKGQHYGCTMVSCCCRICHPPALK